MKGTSLITLLIILILGFILRFYHLGQVPVGFHRDEAFLGYSAYSILLTGKDMSGEFLPIHLKSFLYSPGGYSYFSIPFIAIFGLNEFSVRFASALFGSLTIFITFLLTKELFKKENLALVSSFFLAISPWHINLSRVATENVLVVFFISLGVLLYFKWLKKEKALILVLSFFCFALTLLLYQAPRAFLPLFIPLLFFLFHKEPLKRKIILPSLLFFIIIIIPIVGILSSHDLTQRIRMLSIFQNSGTQLVLDEQIREDGSTGGNVLMTRFFHNKLINYSITFFSNYFNHFSYDFLLTDKAFPYRYKVPQMGLIYFFELPLLLFGLWKLSQNDKKIFSFLTIWILLAPLGSAFTYDDVPNLQRTLILFPALSIIIGYGFLEIWKLIKKLPLMALWQGAIIIIMFYGFIYYLHQYFLHQVNHQPWYRQEGYKELVSQVTKLQSSYKKVVITDAESSPSVFFMFYKLYNPLEIQKKIIDTKTTTPGRLYVENYEFPEESCPLQLSKSIDPVTNLPSLSGQKNVLYINSAHCQKLDNGVKTISEIKGSDGNVVFVLQTITQ